MLYTDDTQVYKSFDLDDCLSSILCVEKCVFGVKTWMQLISSCVLSCIDYCNSLLVGLPQYLIKRLQGVQSATDRSILT